MQHRRWNSDEKERLLAAFRESGLSQAAFCRREGLKVSTLQYWMYRLPKRQAAESRFGFVRVLPAQPEASAVVVRIGDVASIRFDTLPAPEYLGRLAREIAC